MVASQTPNTGKPKSRALKHHSISTLSMNSVSSNRPTLSMLSKGMSVPEEIKKSARSGVPSSEHTKRLTPKIPKRTKGVACCVLLSTRRGPTAATHPLTWRAFSRPANSRRTISDEGVLSWSNNNTWLHPCSLAKRMPKLCAAPNPTFVCGRNMKVVWISANSCRVFLAFSSEPLSITTRCDVCGSVADTRAWSCDRSGW